MTGNDEMQLHIPLQSHQFSIYPQPPGTIVCLALVDELNNAATVSGVIYGIIFGAVLMFIIVIGILQKERVRCLYGMPY